MARVAITKDEVAIAFQKLLSEGQPPSAENIHELLGKGSIGTINRFIKEIIDENNQQLLHSSSTEPSTSLASPAQEFKHSKKPLDERRVDLENESIPLHSLSEESLSLKVRRLESMLLKEQARREASERIAVDTQTYAENIKQQVSERINDLKQTMEVVTEQLKQQLKEQKQNYEQDLKFYREQLQKANKKLTELLG